MALNGIDISNNNGAMNLSNVPFDFAICKATEGTGFVDSFCDGFMQQIFSLGRLAGVYHFARTGDAVAQANYFVDNIRGYIGKAALFLDWENAGSYDMSVLSQGPGWAKTWLDTVYELTGVRPMIYMSKSVCREYDWSVVAKDYALWMAQYPDYAPTDYQDNPWTDDGGTGAFPAVAIHQYASSGTLPGYGSYLDLNIFYGDAEAWNKFAAVNGSPSVPAPSPSKRVDIDKLARDVLAGKYGDGDTRKKKLGKNYDAVQKRVNEILAEQTVDYYALALGVLRGDYGNGEDRKKKLGADYGQVQAIIDDAYAKADEVIAGKYGNGDERKQKLGDIYPVVQEVVNQLLS